MVFNTEHLSPLFERVIIASGTSNRQTKALASSVRDAVKQKGLPVPRTEGEDNGEWIIVDCGAAVVHVMQPAIRDYYHLEEIWGDKPVKLKIDSSPVRLVKAEVPAKKSAARSPAAKAAASKPAARSAVAKAPAKKAPARKFTTSATNAGKPPAPRAPAKKAVTRTVGVKKTVAAKAPARKVAAKAPARKPASKAVGKK